MSVPDTEAEMGELEWLAYEKGTNYFSCNTYMSKKWDYTIQSVGCGTS